jgi:hypothetical protein
VTRIHGAEVTGCLTNGKIKLGDLITFVELEGRSTPVRDGRDWKRIKLSRIGSRSESLCKMSIVRHNQSMPLEITKDEFNSIVAETAVLVPKVDMGKLRLVREDKTPTAEPLNMKEEEFESEDPTEESKVYHELLEKAPIWEDGVEPIPDFDENRIKCAQKDIKCQTQKADKWIEKQRPTYGPQRAVDDACALWAILMAFTLLILGVVILAHYTANPDHYNQRPKREIKARKEPDRWRGF